jgi:hypothetical protein
LGKLMMMMILDDDEDVKSLDLSDDDDSQGLAFLSFSKFL